MKSGLIGALIGGFFWMALLGFAVGDPVPVACAVAGFAIGAAAGLRLQERHPRAVAGGAMLWVVAWAAPVLAFYWDAIPESVGPITTGKSPWLAGAVLVVLTLTGLTMLLTRRADR